jgi:hypothetical protein
LHHSVIIMASPELDDFTMYLSHNSSSIINTSLPIKNRCIFPDLLAAIIISVRYKPLYQEEFTLQSNIS